MFYALLSATPEIDLRMRCKDMLHAQRSAEAPVIARSVAKRFSNVPSLSQLEQQPVKHLIRPWYA
eukprot:6191436-Pleurochrysis_carterae.AAC.2